MGPFIIMMKKAVILLSGGLDSATCLAIAADMGCTLYAFTFEYGQRHGNELESAVKLALKYRVEEHKTVNIDLRTFGQSALTDEIDVPKNISINDSMIPITYVPARNTIFLSYALAYAEVIGAFDIFIGVNVLDYSGYPDCRPKYISSFEKMANLATKASVESDQNITIHTPLINMTKSEIIQKGKELNVDYSLTHSCYDPEPDGTSCGECDSCKLRLKGFEEAGFSDPLIYKN